MVRHYMNKCDLIILLCIEIRDARLLVPGVFFMFKNRIFGL